MIPRLDISFSLRRQIQFWHGQQYQPQPNEFLLNHARSGIVLALRTILPAGGRVGVVVYNCYTVANAVVSAGCIPVFLDVNQDLRLKIEDLQDKNLNAIVVTNLFGIRNDISAIRAALPHAVIIVDNAHGYGLPPEGDFTVYSIDQGKYPALGPGGLLFINNPNYISCIELPSTHYSILSQAKLFVSMWIKALLYRPWIYGWLTQPIKARRWAKANHNPVQITTMCPGVSRMYQAWLNEQPNHPLPSGEGMGVRPLFMDIVYTDDPQSVIADYHARGIEVATHFKNCIAWAREFGYADGTCPNAEKLVNTLVMVPNYYKHQ